MSTNKHAIETFNLKIGYPIKGKKEKVIHENLNLKLQFGKVTCLLGLNGAGKSTLLRTLCGFQQPLAGEINLIGRPIKTCSQKEFSQLMGVVLTEKTNAGDLTVYELVSLGRYPFSGFFGQLTHNDHDIILRSLESVGIEHKAYNQISELSDGERQKAIIAKALAQECPIILLDEPTAFLDITSRIEIFVLLQKLAKEQNKAILLSTHDFDVAIQMGDSLWLLDKEKPFECGNPEDLILNHKFASFFNRKDIFFEESTGKLKTSNKFKPISIVGESFTAHWVKNALIRNGFAPTSEQTTSTHIMCESPSLLKVYNENSLYKTAKNIEELIEIVLSI